MRTFLSLLLAVFLACSLAGCSEDSTSGKLLTYPLQSDPTQLDPQLADEYESKILLQNCMEGLTRIASDGSVIPGVAARWDISEDKRTWTFYLRRDTYWSTYNGERVGPVTADDFIFALQRLVDPGTHSTLSHEAQVLENASAITAGTLPKERLGVEKVDDYTLVLHLAYPSEDLHRQAASTSWLPCHQASFEEASGRYGRDKDTLVYNGPFRIMLWEHGESLRLKQNLNYKGHLATSPSGVLFTIGLTSEEMASALLNGEVDAATVPGGLIRKFQDSDYTVTEFQDTAWSLCLNEKQGIFQSKNMRLAVASVMDRTSMYSSLPSYLQPFYSLVPPLAMVGEQSYREESLSSYPVEEDGQAAQRYFSAGLAELGLEEMPEIDLLCPDNADIKLSLGFLLQSMQKHLGLYVNLVPLSQEELNSRVQNGNYQMALYAVQGGSDAASSLLATFQTGATANVTGFSSSSYDAQMSRILTGALSDSEAAQALYACETLLYNETVIIPLYLESRYFILAPHVSGITARSFYNGVSFIEGGKSD